MKLFFYSVYDNKAQAFLPPFLLHNDAVACRAFGDAANDINHQFNKNLTDYNLFRIGEFDDATGNIYPATTFENLGMASSFFSGDRL